MRLWQALLLTVLLGFSALMLIAVSLRGQPAPPSGVQAASGTVTVLLNGLPIGTAGVLNFLPGNGVLWTCRPNPSLNSIDCGSGYNTALIATHDTVHANENFCYSSNGTTLYTCKMPNKALLSYQLGQSFLLLVDTTCAASCQVNIDTVGPITLKQADGVTAPNGTLIAGRARWVWYDGTIFRLI